MGVEPKQAARRLVFFTLFVSYAYFFQGGGWNPNSRLDLTRALANGYGFEIDAYRGNTGDWAFYKGHYYTNKSPGLSLMSLPAFALAQHLDRLLPREEAGRILVSRAYLANLTANVMPAAILGLLIFEILLDLSVATVPTCAGLSLAFGLGTLAFPYSTAYYGHQPAAAFSFAAFFLLNRAEGKGSSRLTSFAAGAAMAAAVSIELSTLVTAAILAAVTVISPGGRQRVVWFIIGATPLALGLAFYHYSCFGHPLATGYDYSNPAVMIRENGHLFGFPKLSRLKALLVSPSRGLLFTSPMLALAAVGLPGLVRTNWCQGLVCLLVPLAYLVFFSSFHGWQGGWAPGPRYLVPCLPFLFLPASFSVRRVPRLLALLSSVSAVIMLLITAVAVEVPAGLANPLADFTLRWITRGRVSVNPQGFDDYLPPAAYLRFQPTDNWNSFNLGELLSPHRITSLLPLILAWALAALALFSTARSAANREA